jgi:hypothetical protein
MNILLLNGAEDLTIPRCVNTSDEAITLVREHHAKWLAENKP